MTRDEAIARLLELADKIKGVRAELGTLEHAEVMARHKALAGSLHESVASSQRYAELEVGETAGEIAKRKNWVRAYEVEVEILRDLLPHLD